MCSVARTCLLILISHAIQSSSAWGPSPLWTNNTRIKRQAKCNENLFTCTSGECLDDAGLCDGIPNCRDASDETPEACSEVPCPKAFFRCNYGACINKNLECNGKSDCADNSDEDNPRCKRQTPNFVTTSPSTKCKTDEFECKSGQCISSEVLCDGKADCNDRSDETAEKCSSVPCPPYAFRCSYGGCVNKQSKCNGVLDCVDGSDEAGCPPTTPIEKPIPGTPTPPTSGCVLPMHPKYGSFRFVNAAIDYTPNSIAKPFSAIVGSCKDGFETAQANAIFCNSNYWSPPIPNIFCIPKCKSLKQSHTYTLTCTFEGKNEDCANARQGTTAFAQCNDHYRSSKIATAFDVEDIVCADGSWSKDPDVCVPVCGQKYVAAETLIIGGNEAQKGEYPWVVAVYNSSNMHICGGSIIHEKYVLSAAHCFSDANTGSLHPSKDYKISAGSYYRTFNDPRDPHKKIIGVQSIFTPDYRGNVHQFTNDIALLKLESQLILSTYIQPVCFEKSFNPDNLADNTPAVVVGWGYTTEGGNPSESQKKLIVHFRRKDVCIKALPPDFGNKFYTYDKICAGFIDKATGVCSGDSGGGLFFESQNDFYVRGIVSLSPPSASGGCDSNYFALYTKVSSHAKWIADKIKETIS